MTKIDIKDLIGGAVENAIARREESLTAEEAKEIQGGFIFPMIFGYIYTGGEDGQRIHFGCPPSP